MSQNIVWLNVMLPLTILKHSALAASMSSSHSLAGKHKSPVLEKPATTAAPVEVITETQLEHVRSLIGEVLTEVVTENNKALEKEISTQVTADVIREMDFLFQAKERQEEEHFRKLDSLIRQQQATRRESVKNSPVLRFKKRFT